MSSRRKRSSVINESNNSCSNSRSYTPVRSYYSKLYDELRSAFGKSASRKGVSAGGRKTIYEFNLNTRKGICESLTREISHLLTTPPSKKLCTDEVPFNEQVPVSKKITSFLKNIVWQVSLYTLRSVPVGPIVHSRRLGMLSNPWYTPLVTLIKRELTSRVIETDIISSIQVRNSIFPGLSQGIYNFLNQIIEKALDDNGNCLGVDCNLLKSFYDNMSIKFVEDGLRHFVSNDDLEYIGNSIFGDTSEE